MAMDGIFLHQITKQLQTYIPAKINKLQQISDTELLFTLRKDHSNFKLLISTHSVYNRINITQKQYITLETPTNFLMVLRKQLDGAIITSIKQLGLDRILKITVEARNELGDIHQKELYLELMGKYANLILVDENNKIIDALKKIPIYENSKRIIQPGANFSLPQPHNKKDPFSVLLNEIDLTQDLTQQLHGFSPLLSKEIQYRLSKKETWNSIINEIKNSNKIYITQYQNNTYFHCIALTHLHTEYEILDLFEGIDFVYFTQEQKVRIKQQTGDLYKLANQELKKNKAKINKLITALEEAKDCDIYRMYGDLIFSNLQSIEKEPMLHLTSFIDNSIINIPIDMRYSLKDNANKYYQKYHKIKRSIPFLKQQIDTCEKEIIYFESLLEQLDIANITDAIEIKEELIKQKYMKAQNHSIRKKKKNAIPNFEKFQLGETFIYVGKNNIQNDYLTWKVAKKNDTWLHAKDFHGSHVIITTNQLNEELLRTGAMLAAYYSKGRYSSSVPVNYCPIHQLKKIPGNKGSLVQLKQYQTIYIDPDKTWLDNFIKNHKL